MCNVGDTNSVPVQNVEEECVCSAPSCCDTEQNYLNKNAEFGSEWDTLYFSAIYLCMLKEK